MPTFKEGNTEYKITTHALKELRKRIKEDAKYLVRHQVVSQAAIDEILDIYSDDRHLAAFWNDRKLASLSEHERIKKISGQITFPLGNSREQAKAKVKGSEGTDTPMTFVQVLRGDYDALIKADADELRAAGYDSYYIRMFIGEKYFGGNSSGEEDK